MAMAMATATHPSHAGLISPSAHPRGFTSMLVRIDSPPIPLFKGRSETLKSHRCLLDVKSNQVQQSTKLVVCSAMNMAADQSGGSGKFSLGRAFQTARQLWDNAPQPVKKFPWSRALDNFIQLILDLVLAVLKFLCVPLLGVSSLSEMSYCAHERKLALVPVPLLIGFVVVGFLQDTALELSPLLKDAKVPWHLIMIAIIFILIKLPGPCYPYWGRIFIPHVANGALFRTLWLMYFWGKKPGKS